MENNKINLNSFFVISVFSLSIFLWSFNPLTLDIIYIIKDILGLEPTAVHHLNVRNSDGIQFRFLYLVLLIKLSYDFFYKKEKINFNLLTWYICFFLVIFLINFKSIIATPKLLYSNILIFLTIIIVSYYWRYLKNIDYLIGIFIFCFTISLIVTGDYLSPEFGMPHQRNAWIDKCGGVTSSFISMFYQGEASLLLQEIYEKKEIQILTDERGYEPQSYSEYAGKLLNYKLTFSEILFKENSHISILAPSIILYSIYKIQNSKIFFYKLILVLFIFLLYTKSTSIFFIGIITSFIIIYIFNRKKFNKKITIIYFLLIFLLGYNFVSDYACQKRLTIITSYITQSTANLNLKIQNIFSNKKIEEKNYAFEYNKKLLKKCMKNKNCDYKKLNFQNSNKVLNNINLSTGVIIMSGEVTIKAFKEKPWGWGLNNYAQAHTYLNNNNQLDLLEDFANHHVIRRLNNSDGSSTALKLIVELGLFSIIIFTIIFLYLLSNKIPIEEKLFYLPLIFMQFLRGVGYFNSGFLIILIFVTLSYFNRKN